MATDAASAPRSDHRDRGEQEEHAEDEHAAAPEIGGRPRRCGGDAPIGKTIQLHVVDTCERSQERLRRTELR